MWRSILVAKLLADGVVLFLSPLPRNRKRWNRESEESWHEKETLKGNRVPPSPPRDLLFTGRHKEASLVTAWNNCSPGDSALPEVYGAFDSKAPICTPVSGDCRRLWGKLSVSKWRAKCIACKLSWESAYNSLFWDVFGLLGRRWSIFRRTLWVLQPTRHSG